MALSSSSSILNQRFHSAPSFQKQKQLNVTLLCVAVEYHKHNNNNYYYTPTITKLGLLHCKRNRPAITLRRIFVPRAALTDNDNDNKNNSHIDIQVTALEEETRDNKNSMNNNNLMERDFRNQVSKFQQALPPVLFMTRRISAPYFTIGLSILATLSVVAIRSYMMKKSNNKRPGTVADLVRRGQLKSDTRGGGISAQLKYDDPFNNPMVKVGKSNSTVEMCGKVYRLAPVTLTSEQRAIHQKRRSRAYEWKRPTVFLKEGDPVPADVDPETIRWIPANHPFATTTSDIDEDLAQTNVYQKHGVPFRIQAEHDALQKKLEGLQSEQKLNKLVIDPGAAKDFGRPFKPHQRSDEHAEANTSNGHPEAKFSESDDVPISPSRNGSTSKEDEFPKT